ncbi:Putative NADPH-dependent methylglyoxal reductase GRP2 [Psilocybe cubensis]|uniref:NAD-dependent epimerase/dehydratase domain-containing protein n=2 Tax=Psilocybe cubensis TaxID=181762 RepID=A0A8H7Y705_PSICU|nr:Putative NADPH-dependent methylglyoxal reductase GRP2 [Psilocybe cubensis]KAH9487420.1 Putative NADPH-dependent methylglyoxal reductase GRP2 [Psilocybe cubensis]
MPVLDAHSGAKVLVTGVNGYVATGVAKELLEQGFSVRGTVIVDDITKEGAFDEAVKGVDAVEHMASPLPGNLKDEDPEVYIKPAVEGTLSIFNSILKHGNQIKRVVLTSSIGAVMPPLRSQTTLNEDNWAEEFVDIVGRRGRDSSSVEKYIASKTLSEKAAWDFYTQNKNQIAWDLVVLNPANALGPQFQDFKSLNELSRSVQVWYEFVAMDQPEEYLQATLSYVDIGDVTLAHVEALKKEAAGGQRIILSSGCMTWQDARNDLFMRKPEYYTSGILKRGNPELRGKVMFTFNSTKAQDILGIKYRTWDETMAATMDEFEKRGFFA